MDRGGCSWIGEAVVWQGSSSVCRAHLPVVGSRRVLLDEELVDGINLIFLQVAAVVVVLISSSVARPTGLFLGFSFHFLTPPDKEGVVVEVNSTETERVD